MNKEYVTIKEAAHRLSLSESRIYQLISDGTFRKAEIRGKAVILLSDIKKYISLQIIG
jgi:excisionase family DNA binding protein